MWYFVFSCFYAASNTSDADCCNRWSLASVCLSCERAVWKQLNGSVPCLGCGPKKYCNRCGPPSIHGKGERVQCGLCQITLATCQSIVCRKSSLKWLVMWWVGLCHTYTQQSVIVFVVDIGLTTDTRPVFTVDNYPVMAPSGVMSWVIVQVTHIFTPNHICVCFPYGFTSDTNTHGSHFLSSSVSLSPASVTLNCYQN